MTRCSHSVCFSLLSSYQSMVILLASTGGLRVPFFIKYPAKISPGTSITSTVSHVDIFTTSLALAGVTTHTAPQLRHIKLDGKNLLTLFDNNSQIDASEANVCESTSQLDRALGCYHTGHSYLYWRSGHYRAMRFFDWKIAVAEIPKKLWLFDLSTDPVEATNIGEDIDPGVLIVWVQQGCFDSPRTLTMNLTNENWIESVQKQLQIVGQIRKDSAMITKMQFACNLFRGLQFIDSQQAVSLWPSLSETVLRVDQPSFLEGTSDGWNARLGEEFVYWPN